jgi:hypothetical protein
MIMKIRWNIFSLLIIGNILIGSEPDQYWLDYKLVMEAATGEGEIDLDAIDSLLKKGANPNARLENYASPLIFATLYKHWECAQRLLEDPRTDPNVRDSNYGTPLMYVVAKGNYDLAMELIRRGAKVDIIGGRCSDSLREMIKNTQCKELIDMMPDEDRYFKEVLLSLKNKFKNKKQNTKELLWNNGILHTHERVQDFFSDLSWDKERLLHIAAKKPTFAADMGLHKLPKGILKLIIEYVQTPGRLK